MSVSKPMKVTRHNLPQAFKKGQAPWNKGRKWDEQTKQKMREALKGRAAWNKGKASPWTSKRNKLVNRLRKDEKHWNWKGGKSKERHKLMGRLEYKQWRSDVFKRDNWTCQTCRLRGGYIEAHHIKAWAKYPDLRFEISNGVTLCQDCHKLVDEYRSRFK